MKKTKITVVYNQVKFLDHGSKADILADNDTVIMAKEVAKTLAKMGFLTNLLELDEKSITGLSRLKTDCFFNLCGGINSLPHSEGLAAMALAKTGKPVVGSGGPAIDLTTDKVATKNIFLQHHLPTPRFLVVPDHNADLSNIKFPVILKPVAEDCSLGISQKSVFKNKTGVSQKVRELLELYREPVLIEEFIDGRELRVSILGNDHNRKVLPISELVFGRFFANKFKIFDFSAKWIIKSNLYKDTYAQSPAHIPKSIQKEIEDISLRAFAVTGCQDYGRVDIRLDKNNRPFILEINANPAIGPDDALATSAKAAGINYGELLETIVKACLSRTTYRHEHYDYLQPRL